MHIQEVIVDGFKSYAHRTVIAGFDPHFNAITGLNGSGKSNILDSICFVLGITNLSHVRAGNLTELVYKQGQAGVTKATVTIVFDNSDESSSPVGYEQCPEVTVTRQVLIGGKSKYIINGRVSPANQVANLFHSVQLNVNNPHFLIMQGRITKVLNMKPHEILGMVEEAAGTRMYENKRISALNTIEKKQKKLDELNNILSEEITPTLERLRGEKQHYLKWSKNNADIERNERFVIASEFMRASETLDINSDEVATMEKQIVELDEKLVQYKEDVGKIDGQISTLSDQISGQFESELKEVRLTENKHSKELVKIMTSSKNKKKAVESAKADLNAARELVSETSAAVQSKEQDISKDAERISGIQKEALDAEQRLKDLNLEYQNMCAGISSSEGVEGKSLPEQISQAHNNANTADAKAKQARMKHAHLTKTIKKIEMDMKKEEKSAEKLAEKKLNACQKVDSIKSEFSQICFSETEFETLENRKSDLESTVENLQESVDTLSAQMQGRLSFNYSDPVRGFDRSKVKGMVANLVKVQDSKHTTALEVVAGGKLYQVVVDEAITGKALLNKGKLKRRVTIIPLDKITPRTIPNAVVKQASSVAKGVGAVASPAIELVGFDEELRNAVEYVFGSSLVVDKVDAANRICDMTKTRTVTLEGDVYDPSGTISGGSKNNLGSTLSKLTELTTATSKLQSVQSELTNINGKLEGMQSMSKKYSKLKGELELAEAELSAVEKHLSQTTYGLIAEKFNSMNKEIHDAELEAESMDKEKETKWALYNELKEKEQELTLNREAKLKEIEAALKKAKTLAVEKSKKANEAETQSQTIVLELNSLKDEVIASEEAVLVAEKVLKEVIDAESEVEIQVGEIKALYEEAKRSLDEITGKIAKSSSELKELNKDKAKMVKIMESAELESKKFSVTISKYHKETSNAQRIVASMLKKYSWIEAEKPAFGVAGGDYDFNATNPDLISKQLQQLRNEQESLAKKINKKVMGMIEKAEGEYTELLRKRKVVENDKKKIQAVIENLDVKKKVELERTWVKVNRDFGSIFSTLLPGASSKLEPPQGMQAWEGLEVKVAFGDVWKESLSELSGGQRSLLALSLILSLLLFKPAPMYILDEVDAALDLSHTQNIGNMLKTHFSQSQFIVVSLKEGMFNNANVIFRTKFVDGVSTVTRTLGVGSSSKTKGKSALRESDRNSLSVESPAKKRTALTRSSRRTGKENN